MAKRHYDEATCIRLLSKKSEIHIDTRGKFINVVKEPQNIGIRSWGKIDYLCHYCGYRWGFTLASRPTKVSKRQASDDDVENNTKSIRKSNKLDMAGMAKAAMKKVKKH